MTMHTYNEVILEGSPLGEPERSHENHGQLFFPPAAGSAAAVRHAGRAASPAAAGTSAAAGGRLPSADQGQLRSFNNRGGTGRRLVLTVYTQAIEPGEGEAVNRITLTGTLCKPRFTGALLWAAASAT